MTEEIPGVNMEDLRLKGFRVHELQASQELPLRRARRDFYKMGLVNGDMTVQYGEELLELKGTVLFFVNPNVPHSVVSRVNRTSGYACLFTEAFMNSRELHDSPLFRVGDNPVIPLDSAHEAFMESIFRKMLAAYHEDYPYKSDLIRNCISLVLHEALRIQPPKHAAFQNGSGRVTHLFLDLLERQFPIERPNGPLRLRNPQQFADRLSLHVNYLNRAVKSVTGKPTSAHIAARIAAEAKALLQYTDWSVADVAYALGFEYPAYFNNYFKRLTGTTPNTFRKV
ncbi:AraC family transcriptional regulator [Mucilaginibacter rigui]|uniref:AraC family transcriptional regulator n=1 Tax=Mucilaginibacter rigui TaxID=534635 RepID=A0ABR7X7U9_9SPHI|nr:helix-turn-helix domain-containing protein [Mucilaginibacter rigui]MBD1386663.1 AraC family transcriptional regulator [Mucilaginibacter rigui]